jgi:uncharacterized protein (TIGR03437 family)
MAVLSVLAILACAPSVVAQTIATIAGNGVAGFSGDNGQATAASLSSPRGIAFDAQGNIYIADRFNHRVRRVTPSGTITTFAGTGVAGFSGDGGLAANAQLNQPEDIWIDAGGTVYIADSSNHRIRRVAVNGIITTVAGVGIDSFNGDGIPAVNAQLNRPTSLVVDASGNIFLADSSNQRIRRVAVNGIISTVAGTGVEGYSGDGGSATAATLRFPVGLAIDNSGNLYIADAGNHVIRRVSASGTITTVVGTGAGAGTDQGTFSGDGGAATSAGLNTAEDVAVDSLDTLFVADSANYRIRRVSGGIITTIAGTGLDGFSGDGGAATSATLNFPWSLSLDASGNLFLGDMFNHRVRRISGAGSAAASPGTGPGGTAGSGAPPAISSGGVVDGASFRSAITAGAIISLFGDSLSGTTTTATSLPLQTNLSGTSVTINGAAAPLFFVSPTQVNAQLPFDLTAGVANVQVTRDGVSGAAQAVTIAAFSPAVFTVPPGGTGPGAILHNSTGVLVSASAPAAREEFISIFCTGLGAVQPPVAPGSPAPSNPLAQTLVPATVTIGGIPAVVTFAGLAPTFAGLYQINAQVPQGVASGDAVPVAVSIGGITSNTVTIAVQ